MKHTKYENHHKFDDSNEVLKWIQKNIEGLDGISLGVGVNKDGTVREIDIGKSLTKADKKIITDKFPELEGKEKVNV
tara:strand:+ start:1607 stop:1837 length:231 start_codon:yes stop_codon:yes gene_type:complete